MTENRWKERILAYNRIAAARAEKATDMDTLIAAILALPPGQGKKIISDEAVLNVLRKYGYSD